MILCTDVSHTLLSFLWRIDIFYQYSGLLWGSCCSVFSIYCFVDYCLSFCPFPFDHCFVFLWFIASDYPFGIFTLYLRSFKNVNFCIICYSNLFFSNFSKQKQVLNRNIGVTKSPTKSMELEHFYCCHVHDLKCQS